VIINWDKMEDVPKGMLLNADGEQMPNLTFACDTETGEVWCFVESGAGLILTKVHSNDALTYHFETTAPLVVEWDDEDAGKQWMEQQTKEKDEDTNVE